MDSNVKIFWSNRNAEFLAFTFVEVKFLVDNSSCSNNKSPTNTIVVMIPYFFNWPHPRIAVTATRGTCTRTWLILMMVTRLALELFLVYNSIPWLTAELRGCVYYCQHLIVIAVSLVRTLSSCHWCLRAFQWKKCRPWIERFHVTSSPLRLWGKTEDSRHVGVQRDRSFYGDLHEMSDILIMLLICVESDKIPLLHKLKQLYHGVR